MRKLTMLLLGCLAVMWASAQETFPVNGTTDPREGYYAFINATIVKDAQITLQNAVLIIKQGKIVSAGIGIAVPKEAVVIDLKGKYIYPSFIDLYSDYGISSGQSQGARGFGGRGGFQNVSNTKGAYGWNEAIKSETDAFKLFANNESKAKDLRSAGFGTVLTHQQDGIARGTGALVTLGTERENFGLIKERAAAFYSFNKGSSTQDYPNSLMGSIALLRQTYLDGQWYKTHPSTEGTNLSLEAWNNNLALPQIFDAGDKWNDLRAAKIGTEYGVQYIIKGGGNEYQRIDDIKASKAAYIIPINFPQVLDVEDPNDARLVALSALKHWEMAPTEPGALEKAGVTFALTTADLKDAGDFISNLRKAITNGLSETKALEALTKIPATLIGVYDKVGSIEEGKLANFIITSGPVFNEKTVFYQNWVLGEKYVITENGWNDYRGNYTLTVKQNGQEKQYTLEVSGKPGKTSASLKAVGDTVKTDVNLAINNNIVKLNWSTKPDSTVKPPITGLNSLSGVITDKLISGDGYSSTGNLVSWSMVLSSPYVEKADTSKKKEHETARVKDSVMYPFNGFGWVEAPKQQDLLIKNTTVWTNEKDGELQNTDVLIKGGKIAAIGKNLAAGSATVIDGTGKHLSAGIIDEHSHIAVSGGVNECSQSVTAEVRIADVILPDDINIYRQLAGGVTSSHILHGSCNTIGGQTQLIKLRWGQDAENLKFANWDPFIKFALGENVKRSYGSSNNRFPDTRMGVEQVLVDEFQRGKDYQALGTDKRRDLELDAISEILV